MSVGDEVHGRERVERPPNKRSGDRRGVDLGQLVAVEHEERVERVEVLDERRRRCLDRSDQALARRCAFDETGREERRHQRTGHARPAQLLEHDGGVGQAEADPSGGLGQAQGEDAGLARARRQRSRSTAPGQVDGGTRLSGSNRRIEQASQLALQTDLVVGQRRSPRQRSFGQAEDALADDVALHLRRAGGDAERECVEPLFDVVGVGQRRVGSSEGQAGPAQQPHGQVAQRMRASW